MFDPNRPVNLGILVASIIGVFIVLGIMVFLVNVAFADEISVAGKVGVIQYDKSKSSEYTGNTCYDSELNYGAFVRLVRNNWIARFDIDQNDTGNTFLNQPNVPYEQINLTQTNYTLSVGSYIYEHLYILLGYSFIKNEGNIEQYPSDPFSYKLHNGFGPALTIGFEKSIGRSFVFTEYRRIWSDLEVDINGQKDFVDNVDNSTVFMGFGLKW